MNTRLHHLKDSAKTYHYVRQFMSKDEYLKKLGAVKLVQPSSLITEDAFPDISLQATTGETISIARAAEKQNIIVFFYPGDKEGLRYPELAGCTPEACNFRDTIEDLKHFNTAVYGISFQPTERQRLFAQTSHLNFPLLSDHNLDLVKALGLPYWESKEGERYPYRQSYLISKGNIIHRYFADVDPNTHIDEILQSLKEMTNLLEPK